MGVRLNHNEVGAFFFFLMASSLTVTIPIQTDPSPFKGTH